MASKASSVSFLGRWNSTIDFLDTLLLFDAPLGIYPDQERVILSALVKRSVSMNSKCANVEAARRPQLPFSNTLSHATCPSPFMFLFLQ